MDAKNRQEMSSSAYLYSQIWTAHISLDVFCPGIGYIFTQWKIFSEMNAITPDTWRIGIGLLVISEQLMSGEILITILTS